MPSSLMLAELGWEWPEPDFFVTDEGYRIRLTEVAPRDVEWQAKLDSSRSMWRDWGRGQEG